MTMNLRQCAREIYMDITRETEEPPDAVAVLLLETYSDLLQGVTWEQLWSWLVGRPDLRESILLKRRDSYFYSDSGVILLGFLVTENQISTPKRWPGDLAILEDFYDTLGVSKTDLF